MCKICKGPWDLEGVRKKAVQAAVRCNARVYAHRRGLQAAEEHVSVCDADILAVELDATKRSLDSLQAMYRVERSGEIGA